MSSPTLLAGTRGELFGFRDVQRFRELIQNRQARIGKVV